MRSSVASVGAAPSSGAFCVNAETAGTVAQAAWADLFIFDPLQAKSTPVHDPVSTLVYASGEVNVRTTVVGGRVVLDDGRITGVDERAILVEAQTLADELARLAGTRVRIDARWQRMVAV